MSASKDAIRLPDPNVTRRNKLIDKKEEMKEYTKYTSTKDTKVRPAAEKIVRSVNPGDRPRVNVLTFQRHKSRVIVTRRTTTTTKGKRM